MRSTAPLLLCLLCLLCACAAGRAERRADGPAQLRAAVVRSARGFLGERRLTVGGRPLPADCWSLPVAAYARSGLALGGGDALGLYHAAADLGRLYSGRQPRPGDLVFTRASAERRETARPAIAPGAEASGAGCPGCSPRPPSPADVHVGVIGEVERDGTVVVYQRMARGVVAYRMNAAHPDDPVEPGTRRPWNDRIAAGHGQSRLAGQLFAAYASFLP